MGDCALVNIYSKVQSDIPPSWVTLEMLQTFSHTLKRLSLATLRLSNSHYLPMKCDSICRNIYIPSFKKHFPLCLDSFDNQNQNILEASSVLLLQNRTYAMRLELSEYGIIWKRPEHIPSWTAGKSGDLIPFENIDKTKPTVSLLNIADDIANADEKTQHLLSIGFSNEQEVRKMAKYQMMRKIQRHKYDENSPEVIIAIMTVDIRYFQNVIAANKKLVRLRVRLEHLIDRRNARLRKLRKLDYKRFEWLLEELGILYKPIPRINLKVTRKRSLRALVALHCKTIREEKLEKYRIELEGLKKSFLEEKRQTLKWIAETEKKLGVPVSVKVPEEVETKLLEGNDNKKSEPITSNY